MTSLIKTVFKITVHNNRSLRLITTDSIGRNLIRISIEVIDRINQFSYSCMIDK